MTPKKPETPEEEWAAIVQTAHAKPTAEDEEAMTPSELDAVLRGAGYDVGKIDRDGDALVKSIADQLAKADASTAAPPVPSPPTSASDVAHSYDLTPPPSSTTATSTPSNVVPLSAKRQPPDDTVLRYITWAAAAILAGLILAKAFGLFGEPHAADPNHPTPPPTKSASPTGQTTPSNADLVAQALGRAKVACDKGKYDDCAQEIFDAEKLDPSLRTRPDVEALQKVSDRRFGK